MKRILGLGLILGFFALPVRADNINALEINKPAAAVAFTQDIDLASYKGVAVQAVYSDGTPVGHSLSDGAKANATLTILSTTSLVNNTVQVGTVTVTFGSVGLSTGPSAGNSTVIIATTVASALRNAFSGESVLKFSTGVVSGNSVVTSTTALVDGSIRYVSASSTNTSWGNPFYVNGTAPAIDVSSDIFTKVGHNLTTGLRVIVSTSAGTIPTGLTASATYYAIYLTPDTYALATSTVNAVAGTKVDITALTGSGTVTVWAPPLTLTSGQTSNNGFKWQASNDGTNYFDLSLTSVTYSAAGNYLWDLSAPNYRWLRMNYVAPSTGGLTITATVNGKR